MMIHHLFFPVHLPPLLSPPDHPHLLDHPPLPDHLPLSLLPLPLRNPNPHPLPALLSLPLPRLLADPVPRTAADPVPRTATDLIPLMTADTAQDTAQLQMVSLKSVSCLIPCYVRAAFDIVHQPECPSFR